MSPQSRNRTVGEKLGAGMHIDEVLAGADGLHGFIDGFQQRLNRASDAVQETFFATRPAGPVAEA